MQRAESSIRVKAPVEEVYRYWRNFENFPGFMEHVDEVRNTDTQGKTSRWKIRGPLGRTVEYDADLTQDEPNRSIGWNSKPGSGSIETTGAVTFAPVGDYTEVHVVMQWYDPPGGPVGEAVSRWLQDPEQMLKEDLQRFKSEVETRAASTGDRR